MRGPVTNSVFGFFIFFRKISTPWAEPRCLVSSPASGTASRIGIRVGAIAALASFPIFMLSRYLQLSALSHTNAHIKRDVESATLALYCIGVFSFIHPFPSLSVDFGATGETRGGLQGTGQRSRERSRAANGEKVRLQNASRQTDFRRLASVRRTFRTGSNTRRRHKSGLALQ